MTTAQIYSAQEIIDSASVSKVQRRAMAVCVLLAIADGFDALIIGFVIPSLAKDWGMSVGALTPVTLTGLIGTILGAMLIAPIGDRLGRRKVILLCVCVFAIFTMAAALSDGPLTLGVLRFIAGLGLGAVPATMMTYVSEFSPARIRTTMITVLGTGLATGGFLGGFLASWIIPGFGWQGIFFVGGVLPLVILPFAFAWLAESPQWEVARGEDARAARLLAKLYPHLKVPLSARFARLPREATRFSYRDFQRTGRLKPTALIWTVYFANFLVIFFAFTWLPSVLSTAGLSGRVSLLATSAFTLGGMVGGLLLGTLIDRLGHRFTILVIAMTVSPVAVVVTAASAGVSLPILFTSLFILGFTVSGASTCMSAVTASVYPVQMRSTGMGWAFGFGRIGSLVGPAIGGALLVLAFSPKTIFMSTLVPIILALLAVLALAAVLKKHPVPVEEQIVVSEQAPLKVDQAD